MQNLNNPNRLSQKKLHLLKRNSFYKKEKKIVSEQIRFLLFYYSNENSILFIVFGNTLFDSFLDVYILPVLIMK